MPDHLPDFASALDSLVRPHIPARLIDEPGWECLLRGMSGLPSPAADGKFGFECDLAATGASADLSLAAPPGSPMARWLIERGRREGADAPAVALANYLDELERPGSFLADLFDGTILEYDMDPASEDRERPPPGLFLCLRRDRDPNHVNAGIVDAALAFATGAAPDPRRLRVLEAIWQAFPTGARLPWCAVMSGRSPAPLRLMTICRRADIPGFLEAIRHPGRLAAVEDVLASVRDFPDRFCLSLDVTSAGLVPRLGIEMHLGRPTERGMWSRFVSAMADRGWLRADKGAALAGCTGSERFFGQDGKLTTLFWGVNHVKAVIAERETTVKGYLVCFLRPAQGAGSALPPK